MANINVNANNSIYNLTVVGFGNLEGSANLIKHFKDSIYGRFKKYVDFYSLDSLDRAEIEPERLNKTSKMMFHCSEDISKTFLGFSSDKSIDERHRVLFGSRSSFDLEYFLTPTPSLSKEALTKSCEEKFGSVNVYEEAFDHDITVSFRTEPTHDSRVYTEIRCSVSPRPEFPFDVVEYFVEMIENAGQFFPDELCSAYISYAPEHMSVTHTAIYFRYDRPNVTEYILGGEWFVYMGKGIKNKLGTDKLNTIAKQAFVAEYENGISYKTNCDISDFDKYRGCLNALLDDILIPSYGEIGWEDLCKGSIRYAIRPKNIHVFRLAPNMERIILSHNCSIEDICRYDVITTDDLMFDLEL